MSLIRIRRAQAGELQDGFFLSGLAIIFAPQVVAGLADRAHSEQVGPNQAPRDHRDRLSMSGILRSWELIGGPSVGLAHELALVDAHRQRSKSDRTSRPGS
jgi:hypothetical protein